ncbi:MAG: TetR/AcrR family transcriptional regulator [Pseudomonadota bacterium]
MQERAQRRISQILQATRELLAEGSASALTTTSIAERANIPVSSVYRYFPNIYSIYHTLFKSISDQQNEAIMQIVSDDSTRPSWRDRTRSVLTLMSTAFENDPAYRPLLELIWSRPELSGPKEEFVGSIAAFLAARWEAGEDGFRDGDPVIVARLTVQIFIAVEAYIAVSLEADKRAQYFEELFVSLESYLANYLRD